MASARVPVARGGARTACPTRLRGHATVLAAAFAASGVLLAIVDRAFARIDGTEPFDFDINLVGARRLLEHRDIYDAAASRAEAVRHVSSALRGAYHDTFTSYVGAPFVAALHAPFTALGHADAVALSRVVNLLCMLGAVGIAAATLPRGSRRVGALVGVGALAMSQPLVATLQLGQLHGVVMLGLALAMWGVATDRPNVAGAGLGLAVVLKLSPVLLVVYLCFRGWQRVVRPEVATAGGLSLVAMVMGTSSAIVTWGRDVVPHLSEGTRYLRNQSLPAVLARITAGSDDIVSQAPIGALRFVGPVVALVGCVTLWRLSRRHAITLPLELGVVVLLLLVAGPLSWDHYYVWAVVAIVSACDLDLWAALSPMTRRAALLVAALAVFALNLAIPESQPVNVAAAWTLRVTTSPYVGGCLLLLSVALLLLNARAEPEPTAGACTAGDVHDENDHDSVVPSFL